jgi:hypothetical protein
VSLGAKPRDLQFHGPFLETRNSIPKQNCHLDRRNHGIEIGASIHSGVTNELEGAAVQRVGAGLGA